MTKKTYKVLVVPGGTEIGLEIYHALRDCKEVSLYSAGMPSSNHAPYVFSRHFEIPSVLDPDGIKGLNVILEKEKIDYIFPAHDDVMMALVGQAAALKAKVVASPLATCQIARSKAKTYQFFEKDLPVPKLYGHSKDIPSYPVFLKPDCSQGSQRVQIARSKEELDFFKRQESDLLTMEYLPGEEYTVDCFSDREKGLLFCGGRQRVRTRAGISMHSRRVEAPIFKKYAKAIAGKLHFYGAWFFQVKKASDGVFKLMEIGPRIAGTMALHRVLGVNFPLLSIYEQERIPVEIMTNNIEVEIDRALTNRYKHRLSYNAVYVDLDDTLLCGKSVNVRLVAFLYQCINRGVKLVLLTKHKAILAKTLERHRLSSLFDDAIFVGAEGRKTDFITEKNSIFIDDSYSERKAVREKTGIPTFDCSMIEMLMDHR